MENQKELLKGTAEELRAVVYELEGMADQGIDPKRLDEISRISLSVAARFLKDIAYTSRKAL